MRDRVETNRQLHSWLSDSHLLTLKNEKTKNYTSFETDATPMSMEVPTNKIVGIGRFYRATNWLDVYNAYLGIGDSQINYSDEKFSHLIELINDQGPAAFVRIANRENTSEPILAVYNGQLDEYYVYGNGSHRTYLAKLLNIECITCQVDIYRPANLMVEP